MVDLPALFEENRATLTVFSIDRSRSTAVLRTLLGAGWAGNVGPDRFVGYRSLPTERLPL